MGLQQNRGLFDGLQARAIIYRQVAERNSTAARNAFTPDAFLAILLFMDNEKNDAVISLNLLSSFVNKKTTRIVFGGVLFFVLLIVLIVWYLHRTLVISTDTTIQNNFTIAAGKEVVLKDSARFLVTGDMTIDGTLICEQGTLPITVGGKLRINGTIACALTDTSPAPLGVAISIAASNIEFGSSAIVAANGHIDIVTDKSQLLSSPESILRAYQETESDVGLTPRIGPFTEKNPTRALTLGDTTKRQEKLFTQEEDSLFTPLLIKTALASGVPSLVLRGVWHIGDGTLLPSGLEIPAPPKGVNNILIHVDMPGGLMKIENAHLIGPSGRDGEDDNAKDCSAQGQNGENAFRLRVNVGKLSINDFRLELGGGGNGGNAETAKNCTPGIARGGSGGEAGNFKMTAEESISIVNFQIIPGSGGKGGNALAIGKEGAGSCPGGDGGDAEATGGAGGKNKKELAAAGKVTGIASIRVGRVAGGKGGNATAQPGKGADGTGCNCSGGDGGSGKATGGAGGSATGDVPIDTIEAHGGDGGNAEVYGAYGGNGGNCPLKASGGTGGKGGDASALAGNEGRGKTADGNPGIIKQQKGGDGGRGGDGCGPGESGPGGIGAPLGKDGVAGKRVCPDGTPEPIPPTPSISISTINAVLYKGKYLPVDQLIIENEAGCGENHWHALGGVVKATDGSLVPDPGPQCGYGKVVDNPTEKVPAEVTKVGGN